MKKYISFFILIFLFCFLETTYGQHKKETGLPFITNYSPKEYRAGQSNWAVIKDDRGVIYFANDNGVLEFDGAAWRLIVLPNQANVRSLAKAPDGKIYVGGTGSFGYLEADSLGQMRYVSLLPNVPDKYRQFSDVWTVHSMSEGIYFATDRFIFLWNGKNIRVWEFENRLHLAIAVNGEYYIRQWGVGLMRMENDSLKLVPDGDRFASERIYVMLPYDDKRILIGTRTQGLFLFDGKTYQPFKTEADAFLAQHQLYLPGAILPDGSITLGTFTGGLVVIDHEGRLLYLLDKKVGLEDNAVDYIYPDPTGEGVWLALYKGISYIETPSPLSVFGSVSGLQFPINDIIRHQGTLYAATNIGTYWLDKNSGNFKLIPGTADQCFDLLSLDDGLYLAQLNAGLVRIDDDQATVIRPSVNYDFRANGILQWHHNPNYLFVSLDDGLGVLKKINNQWKDVYKIPINTTSFYLREDNQGNLWLGSLNSGCIRIQFDFESQDDLTAIKNAKVDFLGIQHGLPPGIIWPFKIGDTIYFASFSGLFVFDANSDRFNKDETFSEVGINSVTQQFFMIEDSDGRVWMNLGAETAVANPNGDGTYSIEKTPFLRFSDDPIFAIYPEENGIVWFGGGESLIRYDSSVKKDYAVDYSALIRRVVVGEDSLIYGGAASVIASDLRSRREAKQSPESKEKIASSSMISRNDKVALDYKNNSLRFEFSAPTYDNPRAILYQSMLEGFDQKWSPWSKENKRDYTNLPAGNYKFHVQAKNIYQHISSEAIYEFKILSPWYSSWWAYVLYILTAGGLIFVFVRFRTRQLRIRSRELEKTVEERTAEIKQRVEELGVINSVQDGLVKELNIQAIYDLVGNRISSLFDIQTVIIRTFDHETGLEHWHFAIEKGERLESEPRPFIWANRQLIKTRKPMLIKKDYVQTAKKYGGSGVTIGKPPKSAVFVPMFIGDEVGGSISLQNVERENAFDEADVRLLNTLASSMSVALENARLFDETKRLLTETEKRANELSIVNRISKALASKLELDTLIHMAGEQMREIFKANIVYVALLDKKANMINFPYGYGDDYPPLPFGEGLTSRIIESGEPLLINRNMDELSEKLGVKRVGVRSASYLGVPIPAGDEIIGVISVQSTEQENRFSENNMRLLTTIAANLGIAIQNAEAYLQINTTVGELNKTLDDLKATQQQLITQEKLASLGALTAGIAHEIKNPLNFVNNFADLTVELVEELREDIEKHKEKVDPADYENLEDILSNLEQNARKINEHGKRADSIVHSMLQHSRGKTGELQETDINAMLEEDMNLAYHGMRAQDSSFNVTMETDLDKSIEKLNIVPQNVSRVFLNIITNGFYEVHRKKQNNGDTFAPKVSIYSRNKDKEVEIRIRDNGGGIPESVRDKLFNPFFTTKPTGQGTGLGLSLSYDIIAKEHHGDITFESKEGEYTEFIITLPKNGK